MFDILYTYLSQRMQLTLQEFDLVRDLFIPRSMKKGELLLREGEVAKYGAFVCTGCLRSYVVDNKGKEHIVQFAPENWWLSDIDSMLHKKPSLYFMDAIEPTEVLLAEMASFQKMLDQLPGFLPNHSDLVNKNIPPPKTKESFHPSLLMQKQSIRSF